MTATSRLIPVAILLATSLLVAPRELLIAQRAAPGRANMPFADAQPVLDAIRPDLLPSGLRERPASAVAREWDAWVQARDAHVRRRLELGDEDSVINLLLFGSSFTRQPRATAREILARAREGRLAEFVQTPLVQRRIADLVAAAAAPGENERLAFVHGVMQRAATEPRRYLEEGLRRVLAEYDAYARTPAAERSVRFDERGLSSDTSIFPGFSIEQALAAVASAGLLAAGSVDRVAIVGPGLDFTDKREGHDFYPQQTLQPFAVIDSLIRLGLASRTDLTAATFDVSRRVNQHLEAAGERARAGSAYILHLPRDTMASWNPDLTAYWKRFGDQIGEPVAPLPIPEGVGNLEVRAVRVSAARMPGITPHDLNIVLQRLDGLADEERFDLIVATNLLVYYDVFERSLALVNVAHMLRAGGLFLANNSMPVIVPDSMEAMGSSDSVFSSQINDRDRIHWYRKR
jgi:hypothetical protein